MKSEVKYTSENLEAFARAFLLSGDAEKAYRDTFKTRGASKIAWPGAVLVGDERVRAHLDAIKAREAAAVLGAVVLERRAADVGRREQLEIGGKMGKRRGLTRGGNFRRCWSAWRIWRNSGNRRA